MPIGGLIATDRRHFVYQPFRSKSNCAYVINTPQITLTLTLKIFMVFYRFYYLVPGKDIHTYKASLVLCSFDFNKLCTH